METEIGALGYSITLKTIPEHFLKEIKSDLNVKPLEKPGFSFGETESFPVYRLSKNKVYLPRYYAFEKYGPPLKNTLTETKINVHFVGSLREIQEQTIEASLLAFEKNGGGLVSLDTGLGKTVVALKLISILNLKTLIIVHAEFLLEQWVTRIKQFLPDAKVGVIRQDHCQIEGYDICIGMIQSITKREYPKDTFKCFSFMCIDEVHHLGSKTFSSVFFKVQTKYLLGLSATPERKDGLSKVIYYFLGPQIITIRRETNIPSVKFIFTETTNFVEKFNSLGKVNNPLMITDLTLSDSRNNLLVETIEKYLLESRKILVLTDRREHCKVLLERIGTDKGGLYLGGMKTKDRESTTERSVIFGTYQASGEGFDVPELDTLILATPKSDVEQAVGRILRQKNNNEPLVLDIVDSFSIFKGQYYKRRKYYKSAGIKFL